MYDVTLVSVHVRRIDNVTLSRSTNEITVPDENYYEAAFQYFSERYIKSKQGIHAVSLCAK